MMNWFSAGYWMSDGTPPEYIRQITPFHELIKVVEPFSEIASFLRDEFSASYCRVSDEWVAKQLRLALDAGSSFKPRHIFAAYGGCLLALAICLPKRGGSVKVVLLTRTGHQPSLINLLAFASQQ